MTQLLRIAMLYSLLTAACVPPAATPHDLRSMQVTPAEEAAAAALVVDPTPGRIVAHITYHGGIAQEGVDGVGPIFAKANEDKIDGIVFELNTDGGYVDAGWRMSKMIEDSDVPVICIIDGSGISMGMFILQSCPLRLMTKRSVLMTHNPQIEGDAGEEALAGQPVYARAFAEHVCSRTKNPDACKAKMATGRDWWMDHEEAVEQGFVDGVIPSANDFVSALRSAP